MVELNWDLFKELPGADTANWERLCGAVVRRSFGAVGSVRAVSMQPGVEFHLKVERSSGVLGEPGRWWGWQCRWYELRPGSPLGGRRRQKVEDAIRKTEKHVPGITDWVLWTRKPLTKADQKWFRGIETPMELHLWTEADLDSHLVGDAAILRETFFGELILTPERLRDLRAHSLAPVRERWNPEVHVQVEAEHSVRRVLGEQRYWSEVGTAERSLATLDAELTELASELEDSLRVDVLALAKDIEQVRETFVAVGRAWTDSDWAAAKAMASSEWSPRLTEAGGRRLARTLRRLRHVSSFAVQAALAQRQNAMRLFATLREDLAVNLIAVVGEARQGKTHLAAGLTASSGERLDGLYMEAWPLKRRGTLDDLLPRLRGLPAGSFEEVLEAVEAAGMRAGVRIPIVIDGLNESEDPANWKGELETLGVTLSRLSHVVVVVTLRPSVEEIALPQSSTVVELTGFDSDALTEEAVQRYFDYYKIDVGTRDLPRWRFRDPLFLRIFCEATNPDRQVWVGAQGAPTSLVTAFSQFRESTVKRIANAPGKIRRDPEDILRALQDISLTLWHTNRRAMPFQELRNLIRDDSADWTESLARSLVDEGILTRDRYGDREERSAFLFDAFAGFAIADALTQQMNRDDFAAWLAGGGTLALLGTDREHSHPLAADIRKGLAGLVPRKFPTMQLWSFLDGGLREEAIIDASELEAWLLDEDSVKEISKLALLPRRPRLRDIFHRFRETRDAVGHPLNAELLDRLLGGQNVTDRDLRWSEWIRHSEDAVLWDIDELVEAWQASTERTQDDHLGALWVKWLLTSTVRRVRDHATRALYWYGRGEPASLFGLVLGGLKANDPYIPERLLAAAFGVMMAAPGEQRTFGAELLAFLSGLWTALCGDDATSPTEHWLSREYVIGMVEVTRRHYSVALGPWEQGCPFAAPRRPLPILRDDPRVADGEIVYGLHFANYTVGRLVPSRGNYQYDHAGYQEVLSWMRGRMWDLGWRPEPFKTIDRNVAESLRHPIPRADRVDAYTKKYGWIGFYEAAGRLQDEGRLPHSREEVRLSDVDIDPSFPKVASGTPLPMSVWLPDEPLDLPKWIREGRVHVPDSLLRPEALEGCDGPWVALAGTLKQEELESRREVFGFVQGVFVQRGREEQFKEAFFAQVDPREWLPEPPEDHLLFAGEMPWSPYARRGRSAEDLGQLYAGSVMDLEGQDVKIEFPVHRYFWQAEEPSVNDSAAQTVPAVTFAEAFDLRVLPCSLDWCDAHGQRASITLSDPPGFSVGYMLYLREDLVKRYCDDLGFELVWVAWGERDLCLVEPWERPDWIYPMYEKSEHVWQQLTMLGEVSPR